MVDSSYFHCTLYKFSSAAWKEIIARFNAAVQDVSARCWYDTEQDVSPQSIWEATTRSMSDHR